MTAREQKAFKQYFHKIMLKEIKVMEKKEQIFDDWPERYDNWFETSIGKVIKKFEVDLTMDMLKPGSRQYILDAGCGTGIFTEYFLNAGAKIKGLDLSEPMLKRAAEKFKDRDFSCLAGDITRLPFEDEIFDKAISITSIEFIKDGKKAVDELFRVVKRGGFVLAATLNSLSPWAARRTEQGKKGHSIFKSAIFRSPEEMLALAPGIAGEYRTCIHFAKDEDPEKALKIEETNKGLDSGAFLMVKWIKP